MKPILKAYTPVQTLAQTGIATVRLFKRVQRIDKFPDNKTAEQWPRSLFAAEADRFDLWAVNLGLFVSGHGSLDYRLREAERLESTIRRFIEDLNSSLNEVLEYCAGQYDESEDERGSQDVSASRPFSDFLEEDQNEELDSDEESDIDLLFDGVKDPIDRLFKISTRIRNPSSRLGSSKALQYQQIDQDSGIDLLQVFRDFDHDYASSLFLQYRKSKALEELETTKPAEDAIAKDDDNFVWEPIRTILAQHHGEIGSVRESFLVRRIASANTRRRQQFAYWKKHRDKLAHHTKNFKSNIDEDKSLAPVKVNIGHHQGDQLKTPGMTIPQSVTTASRLNIPHIFDQDQRSTVSVSEYSPSAWKPGKEIVEFPPAPKRDLEERFFECPYCFTLCTAETLADKAWKAHLIHDLRPYVCTYEDCRNADQLYDNRQDWIQHEHSHRRVWRCLEHAKQISVSLDDFRSHLQTEHEDCKDEAIQRSRIQAAETTLELSDRCCPICSLQLESAKSLHSHIGLHLERFSLFSLPRSVDHGTEEQNEGDSGKANIAAEGSRDDDFEKVSDMEFKDSDNDHDSANVDITLEKLAKAEPEFDLDEDPTGRSARAMDRWRKAISVIGTRGKAEALKTIAKDLSSTEETLEIEYNLNDQVANARIIANALRLPNGVNTEPFIHILPRLTHRQIMELRTEYKKNVYINEPSPDSVNLAQNISSRLSETGVLLPFATIAFVTALGKWESEAYWIRTWVYNQKLPDSLLVEALFGRSSTETDGIKNAFRDKKYNDNLESCLEGEIPEGSFHDMVLISLRGKSGPKNEFSFQAMSQDAGILRKCRSHPVLHDGDLSVEIRNMINRLLRQSDKDLKDVFRHYEETFQSRFVDDLLGTSYDDPVYLNASVANQQVYRSLAYIVGRATDKPLCDAELIFDALQLNLKSQVRSDLLASRLIRYHWDREYMTLVKGAYLNKFGVRMEDAVREGTRGDWGRVCQVLCEDVPDSSIATTTTERGDLN